MPCSALFYGCNLLEDFFSIIIDMGKKYDT